MRNTIILACIMGFQFFAQANMLPPPDTIRTAVKKDQVKEYCVDTTQFQGNMLSMENICPSESGVFVNMVLDGYCLSYGGLALGTEHACLAFCDDMGVCDTTIVAVTVVPDSVSLLLPIAVDDVAMTNENQSVVIDLLDNDVLPNNGAFTSLTVIQASSNGAEMVTDGLLTYTPTNGYCGAVDTIDYEVCNIAGCDSALVLIDVAPCVEFEGLHVFDGFSPNGDGINDKWRILGLEELPKNQVLVYNRWGNLVFNKKDYQSDWDGTWDENALPSGTYFYIVNDGAGKKYTGSLQIGY